MMDAYIEALREYEAEIAPAAAIFAHARRRLRDRLGELLTVDDRVDARLLGMYVASADPEEPDGLHRTAEDAMASPERGGSSGPQGIPAPAPSAAGDDRPAEIDPASAGAEEPVAVPTAVIPPAPTSTNGQAREVRTPVATFRCSAPGCSRSFTSQTGLNIHIGHAHSPQSAQRAVPGPGAAHRDLPRAVGDIE